MEQLSLAEFVPNHCFVCKVLSDHSIIHLIHQFQVNEGLVRIIEGHYVRVYHINIVDADKHHRFGVEFV